MCLRVVGVGGGVVSLVVDTLPSMQSRGHDNTLGRADAQRLGRVHERLNAVLWDLFVLLRELDTDEARARNAMTDAVSWLCFDLGVTPKTARAWMRAAHAFTGLPEISAAFGAGVVSLDEVLVLCRYATAENEAMLLAVTREVPVEDLAAEIRALLDTKPAPKPPLRDVPLVESWWEEDVFHLRGRVPGADGVLVETTLLRLGAQAPLDPDSGLFRDPVERAGQALVQMASEATAEDRDHDRATVVVHVSLQDLVDPEAIINLGGRDYTGEELQRLTCDGRIQPAVDHHGVTIGIGRVSRHIPRWLRTILTNRDQGCRFPSCRRTRWTHAHHITHWANGGTTNLDNLITLCGYHHRLIHRRHWHIRGNPNHTVTFHNRLGQQYTPIRKIQPEWQHRLITQTTNAPRLPNPQPLPTTTHPP